MRNRFLALVCLIAAASCGAGQIEPTQCGDGVVAGSEQCDDANLQDGDGCSATCQLEDDEDAQFACVESFTVEEFYFGSGAMVASAEGTILVGGAIITEQREAHGWIGAFDTAGEQLWSLELEDDHWIRALRARGDGFIALDYHQGPKQFNLLELDDSGNLVTGTMLATDGRPRAMLDTPDGLLLAGDIHPESTVKPDLWLGRLGGDGTIEDLMTEDYAGFGDSFIAVEQMGDAIGVLASVGLINHGDGDLIEFDVEGTMLIEYDQSLVQTHRTLIADEELKVSWVPNDLVGAPSGTWIIAGHQPGVIAPTVAWAVGVRDGGLAWSHVIEAPDVPGELPLAALRAGAALEHAFVVGALIAEAGYSQLLLRLDPHSGAIIERADVVVGDDGPYLNRPSTTTEDRGWFVGHSASEDEQTLWLCNVGL